MLAVLEGAGQLVLLDAGMYSYFAVAVAAAVRSRTVCLRKCILRTADEPTGAFGAYQRSEV